MAYHGESSYEDFNYFTDCRRTCRNCGARSLYLEDGHCPRCNGENVEADVSEDNRRAWAKFYQKHPELAR